MRWIASAAVMLCAFAKLAASSSNKTAKLHRFKSAGIQPLLVMKRDKCPLYGTGLT